MTDESSDIQLECPIPHSLYDRVVPAHGAGGRLMHRLIADVFLAAFDDPELSRGHDGAVFDLPPPLAITTDAFTVSPLRFPGGDIGSLAVYGTVNDLAMCGARPALITAAFVLEEGLPLEDLRRFASSMASAARRGGVRVVSGDTKVVERGHGDGVFITTTGIGSIVAPTPIGPAEVRVGDRVLVSGPVGDHGIAVMTAREDLGLHVAVKSDAAPVAEACLALLDAGIDVHCLRDPTRGGLSSALNEVVATANVGLCVQEAAIPIRPEVADACEVLGLDPLYVACEGRFVAFVARQHADQALAVLRDYGEPALLGEVVAEHPGTVVLESVAGSRRVLDMLSGDQLPRIC